MNIITAVNAITLFCTKVTIDLRCVHVAVVVSSFHHISPPPPPPPGKVSSDQGQVSRSLAKQTLGKRASSRRPSYATSRTRLEKTQAQYTTSVRTEL